MRESGFRQFPQVFQRTILQGLAQDKQFLRESIGLLKPEYFERELDMRVCACIFDIFLKTNHLPSKPILLHAVTSDIEKGMRVKDQAQRKQLIITPVLKLLKRVFKPVDHGHVKYITKQVLDFCRVQELKRSFLEAYDGLERDNDPEKAREFIAKKMRGLGVMGHGGADFFKHIKKLPRELYRDRSRCITTGFKMIDNCMSGGIDPGTETVFIAPAKYGKSFTLVHTGFHNLLRKKTVIHFTLEISENKIMSRYAARISGVPIGELSIRPRRVIRRVRKFLRRHGGRLFVKGYPTKGATVETLKGYVYALINRHDIKPDLIIVDYGDLLRSAAVTGRSEGNERFIQGDVFENLRGMAAEFDCALVTASQCNRAAASKPVIHMEDIAESYMKCQTADHIIAICGTPEERRKNRLRLFFAGSREARTGKIVKVDFEWPKARMTEIQKSLYEDED